MTASPEIFLNWLNGFFSGESARVGATVLTILVSDLFVRLNRIKLTRNWRNEPPDVLRGKLVWAQNLIRLLALVGIVVIWASKIAGAILSVAALVGALLLVHKELLMCLTGYALIMATRPYTIGDYVEVGGQSGRVIDISLFATVLSETSSVNQLTGKTVSFPNSLLYSTAVRNMSATGQFIVSLYRIAVAVNIDFDLAEECALEAADKVTAQWQERADLHLRGVESHGFLDLPSSRPKVLWESPNEKHHVLTIRFACPMTARVAAEQELFRIFWRLYRHRLLVRQTEA